MAETPLELVELEIADYETTIDLITTSPGTIIRGGKRIGSRQQLAEEILDVYQLIGGKTRMAVWANDYPSEFYKLVGKMVPKELKADVDANVELVVSQALAPTALD